MVVDGWGAHIVDQGPHRAQRPAALLRDAADGVQKLLADGGIKGTHGPPHGHPVRDDIGGGAAVDLTDGEDGGCVGEFTRLITVWS